MMDLAQISCPSGCKREWPETFRSKARRVLCCGAPLIFLYSARRRPAAHIPRTADRTSVAHTTHGGGTRPSLCRVREITGKIYWSRCDDPRNSTSVSPSRRRRRRDAVSAVTRAHVLSSAGHERPRQTSKSHRTTRASLSAWSPTHGHAVCGGTAPTCCRSGRTRRAAQR